MKRLHPGSVNIISSIRKSTIDSNIFFHYDKGVADKPINIPLLQASPVVTLAGHILKSQVEISKNKILYLQTHCEMKTEKSSLIISKLSGMFKLIQN